MTIESPCTKICVLDRSSGYCLGCGRSGDEIAGWLGYSAGERRRVTAALPERLARHGRPGALPADD